MSAKVVLSALLLSMLSCSSRSRSLSAPALHLKGAALRSVGRFGPRLSAHIPKDERLSKVFSSIKNSKVELFKWDTKTPVTGRQIAEQLSKEGFRAFSWSDGPKAYYAPHQHNCEESLWVLSGEMTFTIENKEYKMTKGDRLKLPQGVVHSALAGPDGVTYYIGQR
mmetsp:Transcript_28758/g.40070  ORF Transcript_28758/g.40070 Transcript_28758/m.40070 type:complete len:166 (-) Transcript_28758:262-759(-)|eukprot:CAMPEP_0184480000 /NCGR_PEP_ID=MMETSP0113_2-20130426/1494_1 /TAXON_ID=91329 /ORGANISM="Norrisiella sphaerica, Strain BC52" /LENGTH=165 /DNA_ID=CAMNT_0026858181 /DNA_START=112 /DNA_END=612 /DNA_ORIENTATION=-